MPFKLLVSPEAIEDIQQAIDWYNEQQKGLGKRFQKEIKNRFNLLRTQPFFAIRYDNVRCLKLRKFLTSFIIQQMRKKRPLPYSV